MNDTFAIWETQCHRFLLLRGSGNSEDFSAHLFQARAGIDRNPQEALRWLSDTLTNNEKKWFVAFLFNENYFDDVHPLQASLLEPMLRAAVYERDPSFNRLFVKPCMRAVGYFPVNEILLAYLEYGTNFEKAGAVNALYHASFRPKFRPEVKSGFYDAEKQDTAWEKCTPESIAEYQATEDLRNRKRSLFLREFVANENIDVRQSLIAKISLNPSDYPGELWPLVEQAIVIARDHPDAYIQNRFKIECGEAKLLKPLPHREAAQ